MDQATMNKDWRDGFLFVGNQLALDFLNTVPVLDGGPKELLPDCASLVRWLVAAELISAADAKRIEPKWTADPACDNMLDELREFRERLRDMVLALEHQIEPSHPFLAEINLQLAAHPYIDQLMPSEAGMIRSKRFVPRTPLDLFAPIADSVAALLTAPDLQRLRKCENCILHFFDTSKKGTRRWCSMNACGNRSKVAAYTKRKKFAASAGSGAVPTVGRTDART
ncbi:MAG: ABATE domain-containing protein [Bryobacteraceae bacterium]